MHLETARRQANVLGASAGSSRARAGRPLVRRIADHASRNERNSEPPCFAIAIQLCDEHSSVETTTSTTITHSIHRQAVRRALVELGLLSITRRSITLPLRLLKLAKIR